MHSIKDNSLFTIGEIVRDKREKFAINSILLEFKQETFMPDFIKGLGHVQENCSNFKTIFIIESFMNFVSKEKELIATGVTWAETRLMFANEIVSD